MIQLVVPNPPLQKKEHFSMILRILRQCEAFCQGAMCSAPRDLLSNIGASVSPLTCGNALPSWEERLGKKHLKTNRAQKNCIRLSNTSINQYLCILLIIPSHTIPTIPPPNIKHTPRNLWFSRGFTHGWDLGGWDLWRTRLFDHV